MKYRNFVFCRQLFSLQFVVRVFVSPLYDLTSESIISSHIITESSIVFAKYLPFVQLHVAGFQI